MPSLTVKEYLERFNLWFYAWIGLPMLLFAWVYLPIKDLLSWGFATESTGFLMLMFSVAIVLVGGSFWSFQQAKRAQKSISKEGTLKDKLTVYQKVWMRPYQWSAGTSLIAVLLLYTTQNLIFVTVYALLLFIVSLFRPHVERLSRDLPLTEEELRKVKNQREVI